MTRKSLDQSIVHRYVGDHFHGKQRLCGGPWLDFRNNCWKKRINSKSKPHAQNLDPAAATPLRVLLLLSALLKWLSTMLALRPLRLGTDSRRCVGASYNRETLHVVKRLHTSRDVWDSNMCSMRHTGAVSKHERTMQIQRFRNME